MDSIRANDLRELFRACDPNKSGFIEKDDLKNACGALTDRELDNLMGSLDTDKDGKINFNEFTAGYKKIMELMDPAARRRSKWRRNSQGSASSPGGSFDMEEYNKFKDRLRQELNVLGYKRQERLCEFYEHLHQQESQSPTLVSDFERLILEVIDDIKLLNSNNEKLAQDLTRTNENHQADLQKIEDEMLTHFKTKELAIREEEQIKARELLVAHDRKMESELNEYRRKLDKLKKMEKECSRREEDMRVINSMKTQIANITDENKRLESLVNEAHLELATTKDNMGKLKEEYERKRKEIEFMHNSRIDGNAEQECLAQQIHSLQETNKRLRDTNDDLKEALEEAHRQMQQLARQNNKIGRLRRDSRVGDYLSGAEMALNSSGISRHSSITDSGRSSFRDVEEMDTDDEEEGQPLSRIANARRNRRHRRSLVNRRRMPSESEETEDGTYVPAEAVDSVDSSAAATSTSRFASLSRFVRSGSIRSLSSIKSTTSTKSHQSRNNATARDSIRSTMRRQQQYEPASPTKEPERMYKIVLCGDTAVGKSSFIIRLCQNRFANNLATTLGVDFQTKTLEVDGHVISLQVWDTCGQERFRSIAKSYFRRADGVLLLYDTTYERSFINVRQWMESIQDATDKEIGVLIVGNKMDEKEKYQRENKRVVHSDEGYKLAREYGALFIETSAKDGRNIVEAVVELTRLLRTNEDLEVRSVGMKLHEKGASAADEDKTKCCK